MNLRICAVSLACLVSLEMAAQTSDRVPHDLFGIALGGIYDLGKGAPTDLGDLPVAKFAAMQRYLGNGIHYYFKPKSEHKDFPYLERRKAATDEFFESSYRLYLLPVLPTNVRSRAEIEKKGYKWEVITIEWSDDAESKDAAYQWARDLCETFKTDIGSTPDVLDDYKAKYFRCTFASGERELEVRSVDLSRRVALSFRGEVFERKDKAVASILGKLAAKKTRR